ncbi:MAG: CUAEP/CCAEP-tail radical SAM protein [Thermomicrobiales bacterium]
MISTAPASTTNTDFQAPGAVLLVSCYELGHQPLNLAFPLAYLRDAGYQPVAIDTSVDRLTDEAIQQARLVAISVPMHTALRLGLQVAEQVRLLNPEAKVCFYGLYAWLNADYLLREIADYVIGGEFEGPLLRLIKSLESGSPGPIEGVSSGDSRAEPSLERVGFFTPDRAALPDLGEYAWLVDGDRNVPGGYAEATRGCHHLCRHCPVVPIYNGRFFAVPRSVVVEDIRRQVIGGAGHITFGDPDALNGPTHLLRILRAIHEEFPDVTYDITTRIEHIIENREILPELGELGVVFIVSAVESVSELVLQKIDKGHTKADIVTALEICDDAGIAIRPSLLPFTPWTTVDDYLELLEFIETQELIENVDPVHLSIRLLVPPGSALLDQPDTADWIGPLDEASFTYTWVHSDPRVDDLQRTIAGIAEQSGERGWDPYRTFAEIRSVAYEAAGKAPPVGAVRRRSRKAPPRLTESWFC